MATFSRPSLGASNGAQAISPNTIQTKDVHKALQVSTKTLDLEIQCQKANGKKPHSIEVVARGFVTCCAKNKAQFEDLIQRLCARYMDVYIVLVKDQNPQDLANLKVDLDVEFEYVGNEFSIPKLKEVGRCALMSQP